MSPLSTANAEFCLDVFKELNNNNVGENIFFSPLSLLYALSMVLLGARRSSAEQMEKVLHFKHDVRSLKPEFKDSSKCSQTGRIHLEFGALFSQINQTGSNSTLGIANRLYGTKEMAFHQKYLSCSEELFGARLQPVDFEHSLEETRKPLMLGLKVKPTGKSVIVEMMHQTGMFKLAFIGEPQMQVLELPYVNNRLSMVILLPVGLANLKQIEKQLNLKTFQKWTSSSNMVKREVEVHIPRFRLEIKYELNTLLRSLGMTDIFDQMRADLSGISPAKHLYLSKVIHKSYVDVNEEGTEAAAATGDNVGVKRLPIRAQFMANHPFLFFIRHIDTNTILFCGRLTSP